MCRSDPGWLVQRQVQVTVNQKSQLVHNYGMTMKTNQTIKFEMPRVRTRAHMVLFCEGTPFKPKRVENKKAYVRRAKHPKHQQET